MSVVALLLLLGLLAAAQTGSTFDVASIKPGGPGTSDPGRVTFPRATLMDLMTQAYDVWVDQISGPDWLTNRDRDVFTVTATMPATTTTEQFRVMLQNLLAERFHLTLHREPRTRPGYELVIASGGPKLKEWTPPTDPAPYHFGVDAKGFPTIAPTQARGVSFTLSTSGRPAPIRIRFRDSMAGFSRALGSEINVSNGTPAYGPQARVADQTGLTGIYEFTLEFTGTMLLPGAMPAPPSSDAGTPAASDPSDAPDIFTAVEKQLGLKLRKVKDVPIEILIIDKIDRVPTDN